MDDPTRAHLPEPLTLGVVGHRRRGLTNADDALLHDRLEALLTGMRDAGAEWLAATLTEGASRCAAEVALGLGYQLHAVLPLDACDYEHDFDGRASRDEFQRLLLAAHRVEEPLASLPVFRVEAYASAGRRLVALSNVLLAVWDGRPPRDRGGTAEVVAAASRAGLPLLWVSALPPHPVVLVAGVDQELASTLGARLGVEVTTHDVSPAAHHPVHQPERPSGGRALPPRLGA